MRLMFAVITGVEMFQPDLGARLHNQFFQVIGHDCSPLFLFTAEAVAGLRWRLGAAERGTSSTNGRGREFHKSRVSRRPGLSSTSDCSPRQSQLFSREVLAQASLGCTSEPRRFA